jgi:hypothetical protein
MQFAKLKKVIPLVTLTGCALIVGAWVKQDSRASEAGPSQSAPADGYSVHVTAPHVVAGKVMGPYHHYCLNRSLSVCVTDRAIRAPAWSRSNTSLPSPSLGQGPSLWPTGTRTGTTTNRR